MTITLNAIAGFCEHKKAKMRVLDVQLLVVYDQLFYSPTYNKRFLGYLTTLFNSRSYIASNSMGECKNGEWIRSSRGELFRFIK